MRECDENHASNEFVHDWAAFQAALGRHRRTLAVQAEVTRLERALALPTQSGPPRGPLEGGSPVRREQA